MSRSDGIFKLNRTLLSLAAVLILSAAPLIGIFAQQDGRNNQAPEPGLVTKLWGLSVGMTKADVSRVKGEPTQETGSSMVYTSTEQDQKQLHFVTFDSHGTLRNVCTSQGNTRLFGLTIGATESQLLSKLGPPKLTRRHDDEASKRVYYPGYGVSFGIENGTINLICIGQSYREDAASADAGLL